MAPNFGALGMTFTVVRGMQAISLIAIIGMTANFVQEMVAANQVPHQVLVGTLSVTCIALLYIGLTYILYLDSQLPLLVSTGLDSAILIAVIVVAVTTGKPLSYLQCSQLSNSTNSTTTASFLSSMGANMTKVNYWIWAGASKSTCYEMKSIWGLSIALCVLFSVSSICTACMWKRQRALAAPPAKDIEG